MEICRLKGVDMGEDLEKFIEKYPTYIEALEMLEDKDQRIAELEQELAELKEKAIVPRYEIGTKLYMIPTEFNRLKGIKDYELLSISLSSIGLRYDLCLNKKEKGIEQFYCASEDMFGQSIFATLEEAQAKLKEMKGNE